MSNLIDMFSLFCSWDMVVDVAVMALARAILAVVATLVVAMVAAFLITTTFLAWKGLLLMTPNLYRTFNRFDCWLIVSDFASIALTRATIVVVVAMVAVFCIITTLRALTGLLFIASNLCSMLSFLYSSDVAVSFATSTLVLAIIAAVVAIVVAVAHIDDDMRWELLLSRLEINDPHTKEVCLVDPYAYSLSRRIKNIAPLPSCGKILGDALLKNTVLTSVDLTMSMLLRPDDLYSLTTTEIETELHSLLTYLKTSTALRSFSLRAKYTSSDLLQRLLLSAVGANSSIETVLCGDKYISHMTLSVRDFHRLAIVPIGHNLPTGSSNTIPRATTMGFRNNTSMENLKLMTPIAAAMITKALPNMRGLQKLTLKYAYNEMYEAWFHRKLANYLRLACVGTDNGAAGAGAGAATGANSTGFNLRSIVMTEFFWDGTEMASLLSALTPDPPSTRADGHVCDDDIHVGTPCLTLSELSFKGGNFEHNAIAPLVAFLQTPTRTVDANGKERILIHSALQSLLLCHFRGICGPPSAEWLHRLADALLKRQNRSTIGSQIRSLSLDRVEPEFLNRLRRKVGRVQLQDLQLHGMSQEASVAFARCFWKLTSINTLVIHGVADRESALRVVHGVKRNRTVRQVTATNKDEDGFDESHLRLMRAYGSRNAFFAALNTSSPINMDANLATVDSTNGSAQVHEVLYPALLQVEEVAPNTKERTMLQRMLALGPDRI